MSNVFEDIYKESFNNRLVKIAEANKVDPAVLISAVEKRAAMGSFVKKEVGKTVASAKNLIDAAKGLGKGVHGAVAAKVDKTKGLQNHMYANLDNASKGFSAMKAALPNAKRAIAGVGTIGAVGAYEAAK
jgi:hypothetical protein